VKLPAGALLRVAAALINAVRTRIVGGRSVKFTARVRHIALALLHPMAARFGAGAPGPRFVLPFMRIAFAKKAGETHLRLTLVDDSGSRIDAIAFGAFKNSESSFASGSFLEKKNRAAAAKNIPPTAKYKYCMVFKLISPFVIMQLNSSPDFGVLPNNMRATTIGPIAVPNEFTPPAKFNR
jgi:hypothetical protein